MKYIALAVVAFAAGAELGLNKDQASARRHVLTEHPKRKGWYLATGPIQLKSGEEFQYDGDLPKGMADALEPQQKAKPGKDAEAKAKADAIVAAEKALAEAEAHLAGATDDATKAIAQVELDRAAADLASLKG